ncbi:hypothetical protein [Nocardia sp. NPDC056100]|uniref:hypothetical protein n=1 Tax=Nocardia sp. NPDC056100 TaxID=3345712 RepID=UPI0035DBDA5B
MTRRATTATDEATRYLASAVHLNDRLADDLIDEHISEPLRAIPPTTGLRSELVLREALTARVRRVVTNAVLLLLLIVLAVLAPPVAALWLASALAWKLAAAAVTLLAWKMLGDDRGRVPRWVHWWLTYLLWGLAFLVVGIAVLGPTLLASGGSDTGLSSDSVGVATDDAVFAAVILVQLILFGTLLTQALLRRLVLDNHFRFGVFDPDATPRPAVQRACGAFTDRLRRYGEADARATSFGPAELVVYRGYDPFVGSGIHLPKWSWSITLELYPADRSAANGTVPEVPTFAPIALQDYVTADLMALRQTPTLTPGWRFEDLHIAHWAVLSSDFLLHYPAAEPLRRQLLEHTNPQLSLTDWATLADSSPEWLRYYRCFRVEGWERQLGVSGFLHVGYQQRTLYLEWQTYALPPIDPAHRAVDTIRPLLLPELWQALCEFALLPLSVPGRIAMLWRWFRDMTGMGRGNWRTPGEAAFAFGTDRNVREAGAGTEYTHFFEATDVERYHRIMQSRIFDAVQRFLGEKGIATGGFESAVVQINNSTHVSGGTFVGSAVGGQQHTVGVGSAVVGTPAPAHT